ncbi:biotin transporter BioY [Corynebacterium sp.]|uniref:biotin transporter BioY n=1 Tax=Corynebacterium sp. TaxID=1720 RepID=UPI0025BC9923|nr:biotin transporter BioY [Corynebacterium sp.]
MMNSPTRTRDVPTRRITAADIALMAAFAALIIVLGAVTVPVGTLGVPVVLQNMGVALTAMVLGWKRGGLAVALFIAVGFVGVPNMAGWKPALAAVAGPTVGYVAGYVVSAVVIGAIAQYAPRRHVARTGVFVLAGLVGICVQYLCGSIGLVFRTGMDFTGALVSNTPFIPGDVIKVLVAALIASAVLRAVPDLVPARRSTRSAGDIGASGTAGAAR